MVIKSTGSNSSLKLYIIQNIDRKLPLDDLSSAKGMNMSEFIRELEAIVFSGTKLNIDYWIDELFDKTNKKKFMITLWILNLMILKRLLKNLTEIMTIKNCDYTG